MEKGLSALAKTMCVVIVIVFLAIIITLIVSYIQSKSSVSPLNNTKNNITEEIVNSTNKDLNYYLPAEFAAIKLTRGYMDANVTGVLIYFEDDSKTYKYNSSNYPRKDETRTYTILKDELTPKVSDNWDFTKVKKVSLRYILGNGELSVIIKTIEIDPNKTKEEFGEECLIAEGQDNVVCS